MLSSKTNLTGDNTMNTKNTYQEMKITKIINTTIDENTYFLLHALMTKHFLTISQALREMINNAVQDYNETEPSYNFRYDLRGCHKVDLPYKVGVGVNNDTYEQLVKMKDELGVSSVSALARRIYQHIIIGYWLDCYQEGDEVQ
jgi:hypothetical protein